MEIVNKIKKSNNNNIKRKLNRLCRKLQIQIQRCKEYNVFVSK